MTAPTEANDLMSSLQTATIILGFFGLLVAIFGKEIQKAKQTPKRQAKTRKRKGAKHGKQARKTRKAKPKSNAGETPKWKEFMKPEDYSRESHERINDYHSRRDGIKPETDGWQKDGGRVPI